MPRFISTFTPEQADFIKKNIKGRSTKELTEMFNAHFGLNVCVNKIVNYKEHHKLSNGLGHRFVKGEVPWNKGKGGYRSRKYKPVGTERLNSRGYVLIKTAEPSPKDWKLKHLAIWEEANGPVPAGHAVIFGDGNRQNVTLENLILVSREQLGMLCGRGLIQNNAELTKAGIIISDIYLEIAKREKTLKKLAR